MKIIEYHRPDQIEQAIALLQRPDQRTLPLGGGTWLNQPGGEPVAVVDLQSLGMDGLQRHGQFLQLGAALRLQSLLEQTEASKLGLPSALADIIRHEATYNLRQAATVAGTLVACNGRSPLTAAFLALEASVYLLPDGQEVGLGDLLPLRNERLRGRLITRITIPLNARLAYADYKKVFTSERFLQLKANGARDGPGPHSPPQRCRTAPPPTGTPPWASRCCPR